MAASFEDLLAIVNRLRKECPWDRDQTHESIRGSLIEEAYEAVDAIDRRDMDDLREELGDVLLNVVFHSVMAEESGSFSIGDVIESETRKLVARHPHVFGDADAPDERTVIENWERIKRLEKGRASLLDGLPGALPALQYAQRVQSKAATVGFDFETPEDAWAKVEEELSELAAVGAGDEQRFNDELGDVLFAVVNFARLRGASAETALRQTNRKFERRFRYLEEKLERGGKDLATASLSEMDALWDEAKRFEDD